MARSVVNHVEDFLAERETASGERKSQSSTMLEDREELIVLLRKI